MSEKNESKKSSMTQRIATGAVLVALLALVLYVGGWLFATMAFLALSLALWEELNALSRYGHHPVWWASFAGLAGFRAADDVLFVAGDHPHFNAALLLRPIHRDAARKPGLD